MPLGNIWPLVKKKVSQIDPSMAISISLVLALDANYLRGNISLFFHPGWSPIQAFFTTGKNVLEVGRQMSNVTLSGPV